MSRKHPHFLDILSQYATLTSAVFPLPASKKPALESHNIIVFTLVICWILFGVTYRYDPLYQKSFRRFFTAHKFYADDVINRNIRTLFSGSTILVQHCIAGGIIYYCAFMTLFSNLGQKALFWHYPVLAILGRSNLSIFFWCLAIVLAIEIISLLLLFTTNPRVSHFSQALNIYCWPLQLNLFIATIAAIFFLTGKQPIAMVVTGILFLSFYLAVLRLHQKMLQPASGGKVCGFFLLLQSVTSSLYLH